MTHPQQSRGMRFLALFAFAALLLVPAPAVQASAADPTHLSLNRPVTAVGQELAGQSGPAPVLPSLDNEWILLDGTTSWVPLTAGAVNGLGTMGAWTTWTGPAPACATCSSARAAAGTRTTAWPSGRSR